jgi:hypothetical protein
MASATSRPLSPGHEEVGQDDLVDARVEALQALGPVRGQIRLMSQQRQELAQQTPEERFIIDHEHLHGCAAPGDVQIVTGIPPQSLASRHAALQIARVRV